MADEQIQQIRALYPDYSCTEIANMTGISFKAINMYVFHHKLKHTEECTIRLRKKSNFNMVMAHNEAVNRRSTETKKKIARMEVIRLLSGEKQKTNMRLSILPMKMRLRMTYMCNVFHYFRDDDINKVVLYYDSETNRSLLSEKRAKEQFGIKFIQAD